MAYISDRRLYLNADKSRVVEEGDPDASFLLVGEGGQLPDDEALQWGLKSSGKTEDKAVAGPAEDKSLDGMTKDELIAEAEARGVEVAKSWTKDEIRSAIEEG